MSFKHILIGTALGAAITYLTLAGHTAKKIARRNTELEIAYKGVIESQNHLLQLNEDYQRRQDFLIMDYEDRVVLLSRIDSNLANIVFGKETNEVNLARLYVNMQDMQETSKQIHEIIRKTTPLSTNELFFLEKPPR